MHELSFTLAAWQAAQEPAWLVRAVDTVGFGARRDVESMIVRADGAFDGEILGVAVARRIADRVVAASDGAPAVHEIDLSIHGGDAVEAGLTCGGSLQLVVQPVASVPSALITELRARAAVAYATRLDGRHASSLVVDASGASTATLGDALVDQQIVDLANDILGRGQSVRRVVQSGSARVLLDVYQPTAKAVIVGTGDLAGALAAQLTLIDWDVVIVGDLATALAAVGELSKMDATIVLSHDPTVDAPVLAAALRGDVGYVGALGSRRTQAARAERLEAQSVDARRLAAIRGPAGLDIGTSGPAETAVSIVAEILAVRSGRSAQPLRDNTNPIHVSR